MAGWHDERLEAQARAYDRSQALLFLLRFALLLAMAAAFWASGLSAALSEGLRGKLSFPFAWPVICAMFTALSVFGYEVVLFPLSVLADYSIEKAHGRLEAEFGEWLRGYLTTLVLEVGIMTAGFTGLYVLMWVFPEWWWMAATGVYAGVVVGLGEWGPTRLLPRVRPPVAAEDAELAAELRRVGREAGVEMEGAAWWDFEHQEELEAVRLSGKGRRLRAIYSRRAWRELGVRERVFLAARQMAFRRNGAGAWAQALHVGLAGAVWWGAARLTHGAAAARGLAGAGDPVAFPFLVASLFSLAAVAGVALHAVDRRMELRADRFALRNAGGVEALRTCLQDDFARAPHAVEAPGWQVVLLRRTPTAARRLAAAEAAGRRG